MNLPPLGALRAFEAAARHLSMKQAAEELRVTPGAVSLQIKELEATLGVPLFIRRTRSLALTPQGSTYFTALRPAFRLIRESTAEIIASARAPVLTVGCTPTFAAQWLMPRLARFETQAPEVDVRISATNRIADFSRDGIDIAVRHGFGQYDGLASERLLNDDLTPVCSPALLGRIGDLASPDDLARTALLHDASRRDWQLWLKAAGAACVDGSRGPVFVDSNGAIEAAKAGHGVALARLSFVERELAEGSLIAPFPQRITSDLAYYLVYPAGALDRPHVASFRTWLLAEAECLTARSQPA
ncbi:transcriptional regulator GcvA [Pedomonas mirosovicensis]|uniref:transcriptional regulator GcvA n=1 Tax=Pedomonas mirosovicensis TaxID=2908641 RepID=UPI002169AACE|nr:transcriptional regulator GcvA [Pedomonas mirosovicensis]MCH8685976.1 transcriptional regulator GcvA [Pedomonas mirosovicensis]